MIEIVETADPADLEEAFRIRRLVFCDEQAVDPAEEFDGEDDRCRQYLARHDGRAVGTARLNELAPRHYKIQRVAVLAGDRKNGIGTALMERTIADARAAGATDIVIHAQCHAEAFYMALGFRRVGDMFDEAGIPHIRMELA